MVVVHSLAAARRLNDGHIGIGHDWRFRHLYLGRHQIAYVSFPVKTHMLAIQTNGEQFVFHAIA
jgi:hypothetical protein